MERNFMQLVQFLVVLAIRDQYFIAEKFKVLFLFSMMCKLTFDGSLAVPSSSRTFFPMLEDQLE